MTLNQTDRRRTRSPEPVCWWCKTPTDTETRYRGYDPDDPVMAEFGGTVSAYVCSPACPSRPPKAVVHRIRRWAA